MSSEFKDDRGNLVSFDEWADTKGAKKWLREGHGTEWLADQRNETVKETEEYLKRIDDPPWWWLLWHWFKRKWHDG
jgi:hypothetical protein